jgi:chaperonin GroEL (HSP60 family)
VIAVALEDGKITVGGGSAAVELSLGLQEFASTVGGRAQMAIEGFANAIEIIPKALATNAGMDAIDMLIELRKAHTKGKKHHGIDVLGGGPADMKKLDVIEPLRVGTQAIKSATDAAVMILRIDDVIAAKELGGAGGGMPPGGMGGMPPGGMGGMPEM